MTWRSVVVTQAAQLKYKHKALVVMQDAGEVSVPLEDIAVIIIDQPQVILTAKLLSCCADAGVAVITVNFSHVPNGLFLPYLSHSRTVKVIRQQVALSVPAKKRLCVMV